MAASLAMGRAEVPSKMVGKRVYCVKSDCSGALGSMFAASTRRRRPRPICRACGALPEQAGPGAPPPADSAAAEAWL